MYIPQYTLSWKVYTKLDTKLVGEEGRSDDWVHSRDTHTWQRQRQTQTQTQTQTQRETETESKGVCVCKCVAGSVIGLDLGVLAVLLDFHSLKQKHFAGTWGHPFLVRRCEVKIGDFRFSYIELKPLKPNFWEKGVCWASNCLKKHPFSVCQAFYLCLTTRSKGPVVVQWCLLVTLTMWERVNLMLKQKTSR